MLTTKEMPAEQSQASHARHGIAHYLTGILLAGLVTTITVATLTDHKELGASLLVIARDGNYVMSDSARNVIKKVNKLD